MSVATRLCAQRRDQSHDCHVASTRYCRKRCKPGDSTEHVDSIPSTPYWVHVLPSGCRCGNESQTSTTLRIYPAGRRMTRLPRGHSQQQSPSTNCFVPHSAPQLVKRSVRPTTRIQSPQSPIASSSLRCGFAWGYQKEPWGRSGTFIQREGRTRLCNLFSPQPSRERAVPHSRRAYLRARHFASSQDRPLQSTKHDPTWRLSSGRPALAQCRPKPEGFPTLPQCRSGCDPQAKGRTTNQAAAVAPRRPNGDRQARTVSLSAERGIACKLTTQWSVSSFGRSILPGPGRRG